MLHFSLLSLTIGSCLLHFRLTTLESHPSGAILGPSHGEVKHFRFRKFRRTTMIKRWWIPTHSTIFLTKLSRVIRKRGYLQTLTKMSKILYGTNTMKCISNFTLTYNYRFLALNNVPRYVHAFSETLIFINYIFNYTMIGRIYVSRVSNSRITLGRNSMRWSKSKKGNGDGHGNIRNVNSGVKVARPHPSFIF